MALFIIGDLHLALGCDKPMDIFPGWDGFLEKLEAHWRRDVSSEDTVILAGDISWAMRLENCVEDFSFLESLPGKKILLKGNHDYWWNTLTKMQAFCASHGFASLSFLQNNAYYVDETAICGTRGWMIEAADAHDEKIIARETGRLSLSLAAAEREFPGSYKIAVLHYPPVNMTALVPEFVETMKTHGVNTCYYGHLHGYSIPRAIQGNHDGICYHLISADAIGFKPHRIE